MKESFKFWWLSFGRFLGIALLSFLLTTCLWDDYPPRLVSQTEYETSKHTVQERIYEYPGWSDPSYERIYEVDGEIVAQYEDESDVGISAQNPPRMIKEWLVIMSASHVFFWQPNFESVEFYPLLAENWESFSSREEWGIELNGFYHYVAENVQILDASKSQLQRWVVTYRCSGLVCPGANSPFNAPEILKFYSDNQGQTFHLLSPENS